MNELVIQRILFLIKNREINKRKLALACDFPPGLFTDWAKGKSQPGLRTLVKIADYLNISVDYLLGREEFLKQEYYDTIADYVPPPDFPPNLLNEWKNLTTIQKAKITGYVSGVLETSEYIRNNKEATNV